MSSQAKLAGEVFELVLAGEPASTLAVCLSQVPEDDRQLLLCTACLMRDEIKTNCAERAQEVESFLAGGCPFYQNGRRTCFGDLPTSAPRK